MGIRRRHLTIRFAHGPAFVGNAGAYRRDQHSDPSLFDPLYATGARVYALSQLAGVHDLCTFRYGVERQSPHALYLLATAQLAGASALLQLHSSANGTRRL